MPGVLDHVARYRRGDDLRKDEWQQYSGRKDWRLPSNHLQIQGREVYWDASAVYVDQEGFHRLTSSVKDHADEPCLNQ